MKRLIGVVALCFAVFALIGADDCDATQASNPRSASGVSQARTSVPTGSDGLTAEQRNIRDRLQEDNKPGAIKHLYIISPYSGQVILYSTVRGKVTSGGKRLSPTTVGVARTGQGGLDLHGYDFNGHETNEVLQDDGTYGTSGEYLYWWDVEGRYHQHYLTGGQIVHISSEPLPVKSVTINVEASK